MRKELILGLALSFAAGGAVAQEADFGSWDANGDGYLDEQEFGAGMSESGVFSAYEEDDDGVIGEEEWNAIGTDITWDEWDSDGEYGLTEDEFGTSLYDSADVDDDNLVSEGEWADAQDEGWFGF